MLGRRLGSFRITGVLGEGSMGSVYRAVDERLDREVALKLLPPDWADEPGTRLRFQDEARALARTAHPNIATVHDIITSDAGWVLVMECVPGESLATRLERGPVAERELVPLFAQLAEGLAAAHQQGVIHRDLKPGNIQITPEGRVKILDFGLATIVEPSATPDRAPPGLAGTADGEGLVGTPAYLAPELLAGQAPSTASDLYAIGLMLHESLVGSPVRSGTTVARVFEGIRTTDPLPPSAAGARVTPALEAVIARCLQRDPARRFRSAAELAEALRTIGERAAPAARRSRRLVVLSIVLFGLALASLLATRRWHPARDARTGAIRSIAVLPFDAIGTGASDEALATGFAEELVGQLSYVGSLRVTSFTSVRRFAGTRRPVADLAAELAVDALIEGSIRRQGSRVRAEVRLISGVEDTPLWSRAYEGDASRIMDLQLRVARAIVSEIRVRLTPAERARLASAREPDVRAHALVLRGKHYLDRRTARDLELAQRDLEQAVARDSLYAQAHAALAAVWSSRGLMGLIPPETARTQALPRARRAVELDPDLSDAHTVLGGILHDFDWNWAEAEAEYRRAIELNPSDAMAHHHLAHLLAQQGRFDPARAEARLAAQLAPATLPVVMSEGVIEYFARDFTRALVVFDAARELDSSSVQLHRARAGVFLGLGQEARAVDELAHSFESGGQPALAAGFRAVHARGGITAACAWLAKQLIGARGAGAYVPSEHVAELLARSGDTRSALDWLERAARERDTELNRLAVDPIFDPLRGEPRFRALLEQLRLPELPSARER